MRGRATKQIQYTLVTEDNVLEKIPEIVAFVEKHFPETGLGGYLPWSREKCVKSFMNLFFSGSGYFFYAYADSKTFRDKLLRDKIVGVLILGEESPWFSDSSYFVNVGYYVVPKYRKRGVAQKLLDLGKSWTKALGKPLIVDYRNTDQEFLKKIGTFGKINGFKNLGVSQIYG